MASPQWALDAYGPDTTPTANEACGGGYYWDTINLMLTSPTYPTCDAACSAGCVPYVWGACTDTASVSGTATGQGCADPQEEAGDCVPLSDGTTTTDGLLETPEATAVVVGANDWTATAKALVAGTYMVNAVKEHLLAHGWGRGTRASASPLRSRSSPRRPRS